MGWQPPPRGRPPADEARPETHPSGFVHRARDLLVLTLVVAVTIPGMWILWRYVFNPTTPCSEAGSIVSDTRLANVPLHARQTMLPRHPLDWRLTIDQPTDLAFASQGHGSAQGVEQDWRDALLMHGYRGGRLLAWSEARRDVDARATFEHIVELVSPSEAFAFQRWATAWSCRFMTDVFEVSGIPGGVGSRFRWRDGHESEQVSFVRGDLRAVISATVDEGYRRDNLIALASSAYEETKSPGICEVAVGVAPSSDTDPAVRPRDLLRFVPTEVGGGDISVAEHMASYRLWTGERVARAAAVWPGARSFVSLEILQFDSRERAAAWVQRFLKSACESGTVVRPGPGEIPGSFETVVANPQSVARQIVFVRGPRSYRLDIGGAPFDAPHEFITSVASTVNASAG
jgi:hypothetical protein